MPRQINAGQLLVLTEAYDDYNNVTEVVRAANDFDMTAVAREYFLDETGGVKDQDEVTPKNFIEWLRAQGYVYSEPFEEVPLGYEGGVDEQLICHHESTATYVNHNGMYPFGEMLTQCTECRYIVARREATEAEYLNQFPYMRHPTEDRKYTNDEYQAVLKELAEQRERDAAAEAERAAQQMARHAEEILSVLDMATVLSAAGIIPHKGCTGTVEDIEADETVVAEDASVLVSTVMHNAPKLRLRCKRCGQHFAIA